MTLLAFAFYFIVNLAALMMYAGDKTAAQRRTWRTPEKILLTTSLIGGAFGGMFAMLLFRHKTRKLGFWAVNILGVAVHLILIGIILVIG